MRSLTVLLPLAALGCPKPTPTTPADDDVAATDESAIEAPVMEEEAPPSASQPQDPHSPPEGVQCIVGTASSVLEQSETEATLVLNYPALSWLEYEPATYQGDFTVPVTDASRAAIAAIAANETEGIAILRHDDDGWTAQADGAGCPDGIDRVLPPAE